MKTLTELSALWKTLGDVPVNDDGEIEEPIMHFPISTQREDIWHWFEAQNPAFSVAKAMGLA